MRRAKLGCPPALPLKIGCFAVVAIGRRRFYLPEHYPFLSLGESRCCLNRCRLKPRGTAIDGKGREGESGAEDGLCTHCSGLSALRLAASAMTKTVAVSDTFSRSIVLCIQPHHVSKGLLLLLLLPFFPVRERRHSSPQTTSEAGQTRRWAA